MKIRLLLDENFPAPATLLLQQSGFDVLAISESHPSMADPDVLALAIKQQRWLVTFDLDFGELIYARGHAPPLAVLLIRAQHYQPEHPAKWVSDWVNCEPSRIGMFTVFDGESMRSRPLLRMSAV